MNNRPKQPGEGKTARPEKYAEATQLFGELVGVMERLRSEGGCPWDLEQTHQSIRPYLIEETYEVVEAIDEENPEAMSEELGDLMLQIVFHCRMSEEVGDFDVTDVLRGIISKLIRRHPHVFGDTQVENTEEVLHNWESIKRNEKTRGYLDGVPKDLPALIKAFRLQEKAARVGFDWQRIEEVFEKLEEETAEFRAALQAGNRSELENEFGDFLFSVVNIARFLKVDPERALEDTNRKFKRRFEHIEAELDRRGESFEDVTLDEMETIWQSAKIATNRDGEEKP